MTITRRNYAPDRDFVGIRDFLSQTFAAYRMPLNRRIERWNYARYFVAPVLSDFFDQTPDPDAALEAIRFWEDVISIWESHDGHIVGVVKIEHPHASHPGFGEAFIQRYPDYTHLLDAMLDYAEANLPNRQTNELFLYVSDRDHSLQETLRRRGYCQDTGRPAYDSVYPVGDLPQHDLPLGFRLRSMADDNDIERRRKIYSLAFNHPDPADWPSAHSYKELQKAPDYRKELDLYVVDLVGEHVAFCIAWYDVPNHLGILEPVGTHPDFRRRGLGKEVVFEGIRRLKALGAAEVHIGSGQRFYEAIGFRKVFTSYRWTKRL